MVNRQFPLIAVAAWADTETRASSGTSAFARYTL
jgi:hypothetical protein